MSSTLDPTAITDPARQLGLRIAHIGINATDPEDARRIAGIFSDLMGLAPHETEVSVFSDTLIETMSGCGRGEHGHIGFHVDDIPTAEAYFASRGFVADESSRRLNPDGSTFLVYLTPDIAGFAIHLTQQ